MTLGTRPEMGPTDRDGWQPYQQNRIAPSPAESGAAWVPRHTERAIEQLSAAIITYIALFASAGAIFCQGPSQPHQLRNF